ncbi:MAG: hypothetical protein ISS16_01710 [Ignavibacteria bacterium]|nr:hypothetical protein [Ignavibacteria bacterium]
MKKIKIIILCTYLIPMLMLSGTASAQELETSVKKCETANELALAIFIALKTDNYPEFYKYVADKEEMEKILSIKEYENPAQKEQVLAMVDDYLYTLRKEAKESFEKVYNRGVDRNINWEEAIFDEAEYRLLREEKITRTDVTVYFEYKEDTYYKFEITGCMSTHRGWKLFGKLKWLGED